MLGAQPVVSSYSLPLEKSVTATSNLLITATPLPCVSRSLPVAALKHLRGGGGGEGRGAKAFSLCRNLRHFPLPKTLCVTWLRQNRTWAACSTFERKQGRKFEMIRHGQCHQMCCCVAADPELFKECRGQSVQNSRERQVLLESLPGSSTSAVDEVSRNTKSHHSD